MMESLDLSRSWESVRFRRIIMYRRVSTLSRSSIFEILECLNPFSFYRVVIPNRQFTISLYTLDSENIFTNFSSL